MFFKFLKQSFLLLLLLMAGFSGLAQTSNLPIGKWQLHLPYNQAKAVALAEDIVYCATEGGFFSYDKIYNQLKTLSKQDGFSDVNISTLAYEPETKSLLIAYENTNIDLLRNGDIINISDIFRKFIPGEKRINHIYFKEKAAYLSCSFGVVVLDLVKLEIKDTYSNLGPAGQVLKIYASTILNDSIYVASSSGILAARRSNTNLLDYRNWKTFTPADGLPPATADNYTQIAAFNNKIYAAVTNGALYRYNGKKWTATPVSLVNKVCKQLTTYPEYLLITDEEKLLFLNKNEQLTTRDADLIAQPQMAQPDNSGDIFWIADAQKGLVKLSGTATEAFQPNGPGYNSAFRVYSDNKSLYVLGGGYDQAYQQVNSYFGFAELNNGYWNSYNPIWYPDPKQFPAVQDIVEAVRSPANGKLYLASYGFGVIEWDGLNNFKIYNSGNSTLISSLANNPDFTRVPGITTDADGNIWVTNRSHDLNGPGIHVFRVSTNTWQAYSLTGFPDGDNLEKIIIDNNGYKWMNVSRTSNSSLGLVVFDEIINDYRHLTTNPTSGGLPGLEVYALAIDKNGVIWVGTDKGVAVFYEPENAFKLNFSATLPIIDRRPLLENQVVRAIAIDGANRKWIGTDAGVWLFNEDGDAVIAHFTTQNSPLPSDKISDITVNNGTGEVFLVTQAGLVSYRGTATEPAGKPDCATVFPNPVRPDFTGLVGIFGLPNNGVVKITDISGALVYQTTASGGSVAWDLKDINGNRVKSGVYLAFSTSPDGSQNCISKIAVVSP